MKLNELFEAGPYNIDWNRVARESLPLFVLAQDIKENGIKEPILLKDGSEVPEGIMDAFLTTAAALHDLKKKRNSRN